MLAKNTDPDKCVYSGYGIGSMVSIRVHSFHYLMIMWVKMSLFLELI